MKRFKKLPILLAISILPLSVNGEGVAFDFEGEQFPVKSLNQQREVTGRKGEATLQKEMRNGKESTVAKVTGEGLSIKKISGDPLLGELSAVTVSFAFKPEVAVSTPVYFQRIDRSSSNVGYLSVHSQHNQGDDGARKGTFRLTITNESGAHTIASSEPWIERAHEWHNVAMVFNQGQVRFYLNGNLVGKPVEAPAKVIPTMPDGKGVLRAASGFTGEADELVILPERALDDQQIKTLHAEGIGSETVRAFLDQ